MRKTIFAVSAILAAAFIPMSANADLSDQYDDTSGSCFQIYRNLDALKNRYFCVTSKGNVYRYDYNNSTIGSRIGGKIGEMKTTGRCTAYGCGGKVMQIKIEGEKLVIYECLTSGPGSSECLGNVSRSVWSLYK